MTLTACGGGGSGGNELPQEDTAAPTIVLVSPADNFVDFDINQRITIKFDENIKNAGAAISAFNSSTIFIEKVNLNGDVIPNSKLPLVSPDPYLYNPDTKTVIIRPETGALAVATEYQITVRDLSDVQGNLMPLPMTSRFSTTKSPLAVIQPLDGITTVSRGSSIVVEFNEPMNVLSVSDSFSLEELGTVTPQIYTVTPSNSPLNFISTITADDKFIATFSLVDPTTGEAKLMSENTQYQIKVAMTATDIAGNSLETGAQSFVQSTFTTGTSTSVGERAVKPVYLTATAGDSEVVLKWPSLANTAYYFYVKQGTNGNFIPVANITLPYVPVTSGSEVSLIDANVTNGTLYIYAISAVDIKTNSPLTYGAESFLTISDLAGTVPLETAPSVVSVTAGDKSAEITWDSVIGRSYRVFESLNGSAFNQIGQDIVAGSGQSTLSQSGLLNDNRYQYAVAVLRSDGNESQRTLSAEVIPFGAPLSVTVIPSNGQVTINWPVYTNLSNAVYNVYVSVAGAGYSLLKSNHATGVFIHGIDVASNPIPVINGTNYQYQITTVLIVNATSSESAPVTSAMVRPLAAPAAPLNVTATAGDSFVTINWLVAPSFDYKVYESKDGGAFVLVDTVVGRDVPDGRAVVGVANTRQYIYELSAVNSQGTEGLRATTATVKPIKMATVYTAHRHTCTTSPLPTTIQCWGDNSSGQLGIGTNTRSEPGNIVKSADGLSTWSDWISVTAGQQHTCGIREDANQIRSLYCWGKNFNGQLGNGSQVSSNLPVLVSVPVALGATPVNWTQVSAARDYSCAIHSNATTKGMLFCWGSDRYKQIGNTTTTGDQLLPVTVSGTTTPYTDWIEISAGGQHTCGIRDQASIGTTIWCWGRGANGSLGNNQYTRTGTAIATQEYTNTTDWTSIATGSGHSCAIKAISNTLWCWGNTDYSQTANTFVGTSIKQESSNATNWINVIAQGDNSCGLKKDGTLNCWGKNISGQVGNGAITTKEFTPQIVDSASQSVAVLRWYAVTVGTDHSCGVALVQDSFCLPGDPFCRTYQRDGCWGNADRNRLKNSTSESAVPIQVGQDTDWIDVASGGQTKLGSNLSGFGYQYSTQAMIATRVGANGTVGTSKTIRTWGVNNSGKLGLGLANNVIQAKVPQQLVDEIVAGDVNSIRDYNWLDIEMGSSDSCAIKDDNTLWCWGNNKQTPTQLGTDTWLQIDAGLDHLCGIKTDQSLWCWGRNSHGQLGIGTKDNATHGLESVVNILATTKWQSVSAGDEVSCAITTTKDLYCWGFFLSGPLGVITSTDILKPTTKVTATGNTAITWDKVFTNSRTSCALATASTLTNVNRNLYCWGERGGGANGTTVNTPTVYPVAAITTTTPSPWVDVDISGHTCARKSENADTTSGTLWCWGRNESGQLANGTFEASSFTSNANFWVPIQINLGIRPVLWKRFTTGKDYTCGIASTDNTLWCWGSNFSGQLGTGGAWSTTPRL